MWYRIMTLQNYFFLRKSLRRGRELTILVDERQSMFGEPILAASWSNSLISITLRASTHTNVTSQTIMHHNPKPNQIKNLNFKARIPNPFWLAADLPKGRAVGGPYKKC